MSALTRLMTCLLATSVAASAYAAPSNLCRKESGKFVLDFNIEPSVVVHSAAILDKTFDEVGISGGSPNETVFSLRHTIGQILQSAGADNTAIKREAFLQTLLDTLSPNGRTAVNPDAGVVMPVDGREEQADLSANALLDEGNAQGMRPLGLFNRFDLAPANWAHCGEHRIVYGKKNPGFQNRFLLIFEAVVPNPKPELGEMGCRPVAEFWAKLSTPAAGDDKQITKRLAAFYFEGKTEPSLTKADLLGPVVDFRNYGGDGTRGQVRGNLFMQQPWQLREWLTQPTFDPAGPALAFVVETVKNNPLSELYLDDLSGTGVLNANVASAITTLQGDFVQALSTSIRHNLMSEQSPNYRRLVDGLTDFNLGADNTVTVTEEKILLNTLGLGNDNRFNEHQSQSQDPFNGETDAPPVHAGPTSKLRAMLDQLGELPTSDLNPQTGETILNRAQAGSCGGCHESAVGLVVRQNPDGTPVPWPEAAGRFVHVDEGDRSLSPALTDAFLPFRRYLMGRHLCEVNVAPTLAMGVAAAPAAVTEAAAVANMRFADDIVRDVIGTGASGPLRSRAATPELLTPELFTPELLKAATDLSAPMRESLRQELRAEIGARRRIEEALPGAFVEIRRPH